MVSCSKPLVSHASITDTSSHHAVTGYNMERADPKARAKSSSKSLLLSKGGPSLCYYRKWTDVENASDSETEEELVGVSLRARAKGAFAEEADGKVVS